MATSINDIVLAAKAAPTIHLERAGAGGVSFPRFTTNPKTEPVAYLFEAAAALGGSADSHLVGEIGELLAATGATREYETSACVGLAKVRRLCGRAGYPYPFSESVSLVGLARMYTELKHVEYVVPNASTSITSPYVVLREAVREAYREMQASALNNRSEMRALASAVAAAGRPLRLAEPIAGCEAIF